MSMHNETMMQDAAAGTDTSYSFEPDVRGSYNSRAGNNTFDGILDTGRDADWVAIGLKAGTVYTITVSTRHTEAGVDGNFGTPDDTGGLSDPILTVYDSKGGMVDMNDDVDGAMGDLSSKLEITPDADGVFYIAVSAYDKNPESPNMGGYTVTVVESDVPDPSVGADITGTENNDKLVGTDLSEKINGAGGNDSLYGMGGDDTLQGGSGNDLFVGGPGSDVLQGGEGMDTISYAYSMEGVRVNLMTGVARGGDAGGDSFGDPNADEYTNDIENVRGSMYDDEIVGDAMANKLWGLGGNDDLSGGDGDDTLDGEDGDDALDGGDGVDMLTGGAGADMLTGGDGTDTASYMGSMMGVEVRLHASKAMGGDAEGDIFAGSTTYEHMTLDEDGEMVETESSAVDIEYLTGSDNDDILAGDGRQNTIMGMGGDDKIYGGPGGDADTNTDRLDGGAGNDMIFGGVGDDSLLGGAGDDTLYGGPGQDTYNGEAGNDMIYVDKADITGASDGAINGGENAADEDGDSDTVSFARFTDEDGGVSAVVLGTGLYTNIENAIGTEFDDTITGADEEANIIEGGEGGDELDGGTSTGAGTADTLSYESSDKRVRVDLEANTFVGGHATNDVIEANSFENVIGSAYDDVLTGNTGANVLTGGDGNDELVGGTGDDTLSGGAGNDELSGGVGDDTLEGGAGADELDGGDDSTGTVDERSIAARAAANTLSYASSDTGVSVNLATANVAGGHAQDDEIAVYDDVDHDGDEATDADGDGNNLDDTDTDRIDVASFRHVTGSMGNDSITGDYRMNVLDGMGGDDTLKGGASWDMLTGGAGADRLDGGESGAVIDEDTPANNRAEDIDWAFYRDAEGGVTVNLDTMMGTGGDAMGDTLVDIELVWGSADEENGDTFIASAGVDIIHGDNGPDTLSYETSSMGVIVDLVANQVAWDTDDSPTDNVSGTPADSTSPGAGMPTDDFTTGGIRMFSAVAVAEDGTVTTTATTNPDENINGAAGDFIGGIQNLTGSAHDDVLSGDGQANTLKGEGGADNLFGADGDDKLYGGAGEDRLDGGAGADTLNGGADDDTLNGNAGDDTLNGGAGHDTLNGGDDDDTLSGGAGDDDMNGGDGDDTFIIGLGNGNDYITNFTADTVDEDEIDLQAFEGITSFDDLTMRVRGGNTVIDLSAHGGDSITLVGVTDDLDANDFIFAA